MRTPLFLVVALFLAARIGMAIGEDGFVPIFNGRDLEGWTNVNCAPETWSVTGGVIACTGRPTGALRTLRQYENFILELEWRHLRSGGNAGIFIWSSPLAAPGVPFLQAIEVQVLDHGYGNTDSHTTHGDVFPIHGSTMKPFGRHRGMRSFPSEQRSKPAPEWNHYRIECDKGVIRLHVNGKEVSGGEDCAWRKGYLGLESEGAPTEWRNLRLKELPSTGATAGQSAPEAQGHRPLYNGLDLRGWKCAKPDRWTPSDWRLVLKNAEDAEPLWTEEEFGDFELIVDCRIPAAASSDAVPTLLVRCPAAEPARITLSGSAPGKWMRFTVTCQGRDYSVQVGGHEKHRGSLPEDFSNQRRALGLLAGEGVEFANVYLRELK